MNLSKNGEHPIGCVALFLFNKKNEMFVMERFKKTGFTDAEKAAGKKMLCLPGGKIDWHENPEEAIIRETKEEIGVQLQESDVKFTGFYSSDSWKHINVHTLTLYFAANIPDDQTVQIPKDEQDKMGNPQWIDMFNMPSLFCDCDKVLAKYVAKKGPSPEPMRESRGSYIPSPSIVLPPPPKTKISN